MSGGANSPWTRFFAPLFGAQMAPVSGLRMPAISEGVTSVIVFALVVAGFAVAWWRYATENAQRNAARASGSAETLRMPAVLTNLFYVDAAIDLIFVRSAQLLGEFFGRLFDPHVIDGARPRRRLLGALARYVSAFVSNGPRARVCVDPRFRRGMLHRLLCIAGGPGR